MSEENKQEPQSRNTGGSVERTLQLLQVLAGQGRALSLAQLAEELALPKSTVHRLCTKLADLGFLARDLDARFYSVGPALHELAFGALAYGSFDGLRHNVLTELVGEVGETCNFTTIDGAAVLYLDRVEAPRPWRLTMGVGVHVPLHCTASGKLFLSQMPNDKREKFIGKMKLDALTPNTITNADQLKENLHEISSSGYAIEQEEFVLGLIAIAVPVNDSNGAIRAAIAMHCPTSHVNLEQAMSKLPALKSAASRMRELLDI